MIDVLKRIKKALVPIVVFAVAFVLAKLGVDIPADQIEVAVGALITAILVYLTGNG